MALLVRRKLLEGFVWSANKLARTTPLPAAPRSIFIVQPGHIGDLLVNTPLFDALRRKYPGAKIIVAAGPWNTQALENNPNVDQFVPLKFPWNNKFVQPQGVLDALRFIYKAPEVQALQASAFDIGIDLLGTQFDALLMLRIGVGYRLGIKGGGHGFTAMQQTVRHDPKVRMGTMALQLAQLLGAIDLPSTRPQLFLTDAERAAGEALWQSSVGSVARPKRLVIAPAAGMAPRCWPHENYIQAAGELSADGNIAVTLVGGDDAKELCDRIAAAAPGVQNRCGKLSLRQTFSLIAAADATLSNSNMVVHVAAALGLPAIVALSNSTPLARMEQALWGHDTSRMFGNEVDHPGIYSPPEIVRIVRETLSQSVK
jgi:heptosyltransferase-2